MCNNINNINNNSKNNNNLLHQNTCRRLSIKRAYRMKMYNEIPKGKSLKKPLTLYLLMWRIWWAPNNASKWQMGFISAFKGLFIQFWNCCQHLPVLSTWLSSGCKKVKWSRHRIGVVQRVGRGIALLSHDRDTRRGWVVSSTPRPHFTPGRTRYPFYRRLGVPPGPVWTGGKSRPHRDSIPDRPARSQSLYRLSCPAHKFRMYE